MTALLLRELERVETRVLGAVRCIDAVTRAQIDTPLQLQLAGGTLRRNRSGLYVVVGADALAAHAAAFALPPAAPAPGSVELALSVQDPLGRYLPRRAVLRLPRDPVAGQPDDLFTPVELALYPAAAAPTGANWSLLRASLHAQPGGDALGGALLLVRADGRVLARGLSDWRGEALVPVPGVPVTTWSDDPDAMVVSELAAELQWVFDPAAGLRTPLASVQAGRAPAALPLVDPERLEARAATLPNATQAVALAAGRTLSLSLVLAVP
ncbi:hypothetical protein GCM10007320_62800 [Pseudorhodoferax aquiterrae]|uniref:Uncharacterized protein n=1 Tax=Pseudorhodoferax aquiterrae TaxID=747304 RepID=A0ABQ3GE22_9BURK|nr:hypothetical protein [Pseudorhodoferax aquiterrae]GHD03053.1 hypothetical protein GCM10007320_62800 [Pseudorhodoferax aquiterrae]